MSKFPSQEMDRFNVRLPAGMRDAIAERAKANGRSMNAEIIQIIDDAIERERSPSAGMSMAELEETVKIQKDLLESYSNAIQQGVKMISDVRSNLESKNKKPT